MNEKFELACNLQMFLQCRLSNCECGGYLLYSCDENEKIACLNCDKEKIKKIIEEMNKFYKELETEDWKFHNYNSEGGYPVDDCGDFSPKYSESKHREKINFILDAIKVKRGAEND